MSTAASSEPVALEIPAGAVDGPFDFAALFGNRNPVEMEIGCGKGRFLLEAAAARPAVNFLGVEWSLKYLRIAKDRAARRGLRNVRLFRADARHVLGSLIPEGSLLRVHVYCPDPWPKKRHHKRRLFSPGTVTRLARAIAPGGHLDVSTDVRDYFDAIRALIPDGAEWIATEDPLFPIAVAGGRTSYEIKYAATGRPIHRASWRRLGAGGA